MQEGGLYLLVVVFFKLSGLAKHMLYEEILNTTLKVLLGSSSMLYVFYGLTIFSEL